MIRVRFFLITILLSHSVGAAERKPVSYMRDEQDRIITEALINSFKRECSHKSGLDQSKLIELQEMYARLKKDTSEEAPAALNCYQEKMSQIVGIHQLYDELCSEISTTEFNQRDDGDQLRLMAMTQKYKRGIMPFHDLLNDCVMERSTSNYVVHTLRQKTESATLRRELDKLRLQKPFEPGRVEFR